ncbi:Glycosyl transferase family 2 [Myxococcus fulvus]|uniref:Dolichol-phosphate mannosyltransferase n=1 Tax=Myxococcus fulvus TaxID=33 RepID=A0A511TA64_MYXFU|nr:glycosyltransferase family 2 protein [Myxococcus fulvus]GEN10977.1 dolichol-phosphate mannosyltransferase [Myxococcus fulvus]SET38537.1 Glycosyl transferase family 2 [Myxococcus fulvus]
MAKYPSISLFLPAWNEEDYVERAVSRALEALPQLTDDFEIIVVNDASTDRTQEIAEGMAKRIPQLRVINHPVNLKLGGAMRTGLAASTKDIVVYSDIDLPWDLRELERSLHLMEYLEADMICAFRFDRTSEGPKRIVYSFVYNMLIRALFDIQIKDVNFSFKVMHRRVLESMELKSQGSFIDAELVVKAIRKGFRVFQMGVDYFPRTRGVSTLASPSVIVKMVKELVKLYPETRTPAPPSQPVRLPPSVQPLRTANNRSARG